MPPTVRGVLHFLVWGFLIYSIITSPDRAADIVGDVWDILSLGFLNVGRFAANLVGG